MTPEEARMLLDIYLRMKYQMDEGENFVLTPSECRVLIKFLGPVRQPTPEEAQPGYEIRRPW